MGGAGHSCPNRNPIILLWASIRPVGRFLSSCANFQSAHLPRFRHSQRCKRPKRRAQPPRLQRLCVQGEASSSPRAWRGQAWRKSCTTGVMAQGAEQTNDTRGHAGSHLRLYTAALVRKRDVLHRKSRKRSRRNRVHPVIKSALLSPLFTVRPLESSRGHGEEVFAFGGAVGLDGLC